MCSLPLFRLIQWTSRWPVNSFNLQFNRRNVVDFGGSITSLRTVTLNQQSLKLQAYEANNCERVLTYESDPSDSLSHTLIPGPGILAVGETPPYIDHWLKA